MEDLAWFLKGNRSYGKYLADSSTEFPFTRAKWEANPRRQVGKAAAAKREDRQVSSKSTATTKSNASNKSGEERTGGVTISLQSVEMLTTLNTLVKMNGDRERPRLCGPVCIEPH